MTLGSGAAQLTILIWIRQDWGLRATTIGCNDSWPSSTRISLLRPSGVTESEFDPRVSIFGGDLVKYSWSDHTGKNRFEKRLPPGAYSVVVVVSNGFSAASVGRS